MRKILFPTFLLMCGMSFGQSGSLFDKDLNEYTRVRENNIRCVTDEYNDYIRTNNADYESKEAFEAWLAPRIEAMRALQLTSKTNTVITIPVVVHVIHSGLTVGTGANISLARVQSQITVLNEDFRKILNTPGYSDNEVGADVEVEFCLAQVDPNGNPTDGVDRVAMTGYTWNESNVENILKPQTIWDPTQYFNLWTCAFGGDLNGVLGYAQFPVSSGLSGLSGGTTTANTDGVIADWRAFGSRDIVSGTYYSTYDKGRTVTHEIGHALGLRHIWGDTSSCTVNATDSSNDYCLDTPAASAANYECVTIDSCPANPGNDMVENYMDYTNDECMNIFTENQKTRILTVLQNSPRRSTLSTSSVCTALGVKENAVNSIKIYPNPVTDDLHISVDSGVKLSKVVIYNAVGQLVYKNDLKSATDLTINKTKLGTGLFVVTVYSESDFKTEKVIVK